MSLEAATAVATVVEAYAAAGLVFAVLFLPRGVLRVDPHLVGASLWVRVLLLPGVAALWPLMAYRWASGRPAPAEQTPHRTAAAKAARPSR